MKSKILIFLLFISTSIFSLDIYDYLDMGQKKLFIQDYYSAVEYFKEALNINKYDLAANKGLSDSFFMLGEYDESLLYIDKCIGLNNTALDLKNSRGRILTALARYSEAELEYKSVLDIEIYNVAAKSGLAELRIVAGDLKGSLYDFEKILKLSPDSRRLLLSLVVLYDSQKNYESADNLIQKAIRYYPSDPIVLEGAVRHYMVTKNYSGASLYMDELRLVSSNNEIVLLNAELLLYLEDYDKSLEILTEYMKVEKENPYAYYIASLILDITDKKEQALSLIKRGLDLKPDEELYRFYSEMIMNDLYLLKDDKREEYSKWYHDQGKLLETRYYYEKAKNYYLRGMDLNPFSLDLRISYANILKKMGYKYQYIKELELVAEQDSENEEINETLMIQKSLPVLKLYEKWGSETFSGGNLFSVSLFVSDENEENHLFSSKILMDVSSRFLSGNNKYILKSNSRYNGNFSEAFNKARDSNSDFFLVLEYFEGSRTFSLKASLHLTKSGREIKTFNYLKTGNNRIFNCYENLSKDLNDFFPIIGSVTQIKGDELLIDLGKIHNIEPEMSFDIIKKGSVELVPTEPYLTFDKDKHLGQLLIKTVGESMSEGVFTANSSFNLLNIGDNVLFLNKEASSETEIESKVITDKELIEQLLQVN